MYTGEAVMMQGNLYRFGTGWFFNGLPGIILAPVDILVVLLSGAVAWLVLSAARNRSKWPGKITMIAIAAICAATALIGPIMTMAAPKSTDVDIIGCYAFDANIFTNPLSSAFTEGGLPYIYGFTENEFIIANTATGEVLSYSIEYSKTPVGADEFVTNIDAFGSWLPDLNWYNERYLLAAIESETRLEYALYQMDGELWLVEFRGVGIWTIHRIRKTEATTFADIERAREHYEKNQSLELSDWIYEDTPLRAPRIYENQMTLTDVYRLSRKGAALTLSDFEPFFYQFTQEGFHVRRYDVVGADSVFVTVAADGSLETAALLSRRSPDPNNTVDLREGFAAVAEYMNPLKSFLDFTIDDPWQSSTWESDMLLEDDYFGSNCRYYLTPSRSGKVTILFKNGERMTLKQAWDERRITVGELVANGLSGVNMIPIDNPLGGQFIILSHLHLFTLDGEAYYPSESFMYVIMGEQDNHKVYYDIDELVWILTLYGHDDKAENLRQSIDQDEMTQIAGGNYIPDTVLAKAGIESSIGWTTSSHTPVDFYTRS